MTNARQLAAALLLAGAACARAQAPTASPPLEVGAVAPGFTLPGAAMTGTRPVSLADFRGRTVVLAFFYRARTRG